MSVSGRPYNIVKIQHLLLIETTLYIFEYIGLNNYMYWQKSFDHYINTFITSVSL